MVDVVPEHLEEVRGGKLALIAKTEAAVKDRLTKEITFWDHRAETLKLEAQISPLPPFVLGGLLVVPLGLLAAMAGREARATSATDTPASASRAHAIIAEMERRLGFEPTDRALEKLGYDFAELLARRGAAMTPPPSAASAARLASLWEWVDALEGEKFARRVAPISRARGAGRAGRRLKTGSRPAAHRNVFSSKRFFFFSYLYESIRGGHPSTLHARRRSSVDPSTVEIAKPTEGNEVSRC